MMARSFGMGRTIQSARDWTDFTFCHWAWRAAAFSNCMPEEASSRARPMSMTMDLAAGVEEFFYGGGFGGVLLGVQACLQGSMHLPISP